MLGSFCTDTPSSLDRSSEGVWGKSLRVLPWKDEAISVRGIASSSRFHRDSSQRLRESLLIRALRNSPSSASAGTTAKSPDGGDAASHYKDEEGADQEQPADSGQYQRRTPDAIGQVLPKRAE